MTDQSHFEGAQYTGQVGPLLRLSFLTNILTVLTLGIYRFWAKTRLRRYIWSATRFQGDAFEYTGTGLEKLLGFLIAIVVLAVYLGAINLALFLAGVRLTPDPRTEAEIIAQMTVIMVSFLATLPLIYFAVYRSRRYIMGRTRFRGIRFGMESAAGGYVWRAILYQVLTVVTLGLLLPLQTYRLEKYKTDRTWYGNARFHQGGRWTALYGAMIHVFLAVLLLAIAAGVMFAALSEGAVEPPSLAIVLFVGAYVWLFVGLLVYRVRSFAYLTSNKTLEGEVLFRATPSTASILGRVILGGLALSVIMAVFVGIFVAGASAVAASGATPGTGTILVMVGTYLVLLAALGAGATVLIVQPVLAHIVSTTAVGNASALANVQQRAFDPGADAEGFADALDIGGAI